MFASIRSFFRSSKRSNGKKKNRTPKEQEKKNEEMKEKFYERFQVGKKLGAGNFSVVKQARDTVEERDVAVKIMSKKKLTKEDKEAIKDEVAILKNLQHPNIIDLYGMFEDDQSYFVVTELVQGGELFDRIVEKEFYHESDAAAVIKLMATALGYLNENGVVHRDLKPENILLTDKNDDTTVKLADFGFAKEINPGGEGSELKTTCGTPGYVAPEIIMGKPYGKEVDMWSLGVITFILLCGYPPFYHENQAQLFKLIKKAKYKFDPEFWSEVSDDAKDLVKGLLVVNVEERFTVDDVLDHPWIKNGGCDKDITPALNELRGYQARRRLKKHMLAVKAIKKFEKAGGLAGVVKEKKHELAVTMPVDDMSTLDTVDDESIEVKE